MGGADSVDAAIRAAATLGAIAGWKLVTFTPFDPARKMSEAVATNPQGLSVRIVKGAFTVISALAAPSPPAAALVADLEAKGFRVLALAVGSTGPMQLAGVIALSDPPREDSVSLITELRTLGVRTVMVTGDAPVTARVVADEVGIKGPLCPDSPLRPDVRAEDYEVFAGVMPEDKFALVQALQKLGHIVGMCGDGANDAPALRQAQMGIAVSTATDVAKSAAGIVLTEPGLTGIVVVVREGRTTFQRILTYTFRSIIHKVVQVLFLFVGLVISGTAVLTPLLMILMMVAGDFFALSSATDNVRPSSKPSVWRIGRLTLAGVFSGSAIWCSASLV